MQGRSMLRSQPVFRHKTYIRNLSEKKKKTGLLISRDSSRLTVALVACIYPPFQSFSLCELGQHFCQHALCLVNGDDPLLNGVIALRKFQGKIPKGLNRVGFVVARYAGDLGMKCWYTNEVRYMYTCRQTFTFTSKWPAYAQGAAQPHSQKNGQQAKRNLRRFSFQIRNVWSK